MIKKIYTKDKIIDVFCSEIIHLNKKNRLKINNDYCVLKGDLIEFICGACQKETKQVFKYKHNLCTTDPVCGSCAYKKTMIERFGVDHPRKSKIIQIKTKITTLKKYGYENAIQNKEIKEKVRQTQFDRYGSYAFNTLKQKQTNLKKYESVSPFGSKEIQEKSRQTMKNKSKKDLNISKEKRKNTNLKKYGSSEIFSCEKIREKIKQTNLKKYGVEYPSSSDEIKIKIKNTNKNKTELEKIQRANRNRQTKQKKFFNKLLNSNRLKNKVIPLFLLEEYRGITKKYKWKCVDCSNEFLDHLDDGRIPRCLKCYPIMSGSSRMEKELSEWIKSLNIEIQENIRRIISPLELDIYVPSKKLAIEFNGLYWHSELQRKNKDYHIDKTNRCQEKGIQLIHVWENEWINKQDIVKSIIKSKLGLHDDVVHGRKCIVKKIYNKEASDFYDDNHIQGSVNSSINIGLYHNDELISCLSFSKSRFNKKYDWEITRFANKLNYKIHGGFSKLWSYKPEGSIITYSDKRLFTGEVYKKYMTQLSDSKPSYWYIKNGQIHNRIEFQKHKLSKLETYDSNLTEWENMQLNGYDRIWDCGNRVFIS